MNTMTIKKWKYFLTDVVAWLPLQTCLKTTKTAAKMHSNQIPMSLSLLEESTMEVISHITGLDWILIHSKGKVKHPITPAPVK